MKLFFAAAAAALLFSITSVLAGPPFNTDDPEPVELHHWEFYVATHRLDSPGGASGTAPHFELNYGAIPVVPLAYAFPEGAPAHRGLGDLEVGAKLRFVDEGPGRPMVGMFPLLELPTGDADRNLGGGHTQAFIPLWLQKSFGPWTTYGGAGYWVNPGAGNRDWLYTGWLLQRRFGGAVTVGAEIFHATADHVGGSADTRYNVGLMLDFGERHHLLLSAGRSIEGDVRFEGYAAYQLTL